MPKQVNYPHEQMENVGSSLRGHAETLRTTASEGGGGLPTGSLGNLGESTATTISGHLANVPGQIRQMADREEAHGDRVTQNSQDMRGADQRSKQQLEQIDTDVTEPTVKGLGGSGASGGGGSGPTTSGGASGGQGWDGPNGLHLTPEQNASADAFLGRAHQAEQSITPVVMGAKNDIPGAETVGYPDFVLKSEDSFKRKLATTLQRNPDMTVDEALGNMKDSVRYTMQFPNEGASYTEGVNTAMQRFTDAGIEPVDFRNAWDKPGYQGINSWWRDPSTGHTFEMQFHTPDSFSAKMDTHGLYEQQRLPGVTQEQQNALQQQQDQIFDAVPRPPGASGIRPPSRPGE